MRRAIPKVCLEVSRKMVRIFVAQVESGLLHAGIFQEQLKGALHPPLPQPNMHADAKRTLDVPLQRAHRDAAIPGKGGNTILRGVSPRRPVRDPL